MIDLHTHTLFSDGQLIVSELARRAEETGYRYLGISDHVDSSNLDEVAPRLIRAAEAINPYLSVKVIPGVELTHVPPKMIPDMIARARDLGAAHVVVHGQTLVEPVAPGTNRAAVDGGADILAHPGLITEADVNLASEKGVYLEITTRKGHSLTNGHVARAARKAGANLVINTDSHAPSDLATRDFARSVALGAGLDDDGFIAMIQNAEQLLARLGRQ
jgi:histidinol phosphatase-like PHP family hydrolase